MHGELITQCPVLIGVNEFQIPGLKMETYLKGQILKVTGKLFEDVLCAQEHLKNLYGLEAL